MAARAGFAWLIGDWRPAEGRGVGTALAERVRLLVLDGRLPQQVRLPAERDLAATLGISRTTVAAAYRRLRDAGLLDSRRGPVPAPLATHGAATSPLVCSVGSVSKSWWGGRRWAGSGPRPPRCGGSRRCARPSTWAPPSSTSSSRPA